MPSKRPAIMLGVRAALATMAPTLLGVATGWEGARWATIIGFSAAVADKGGAYRTRAFAMASVTTGCTLAVALASQATAPWSGAVLMLVVAAVGGALRVLGPEMASVGTSSAVMLAIALEIRPSSSEAAPAIFAALAGGVWAMTLSLFFWPIRVYRPARRAIARVYRELEIHARAMATELEEGDVEGWRAMIRRDHRTIRERLEEARAVLSATRRGNRGESGRGARLLALFTIADQTFAALVALGDGPEETHDAATRAELVKRLRETAVMLASVAAAIEVEEKVAAPTAKAAPSSTGRDPTLVVLARVERWLELAGEITATLHDDGALPSFGSALEPPPFAHPDSPFAGLHAIASPKSSVSRHAARLGIVASIAVLVAGVLHLQRGYWITLTVIVVLQPYTPETLTKGLQRIGGTIAGGALASLLVFVVREPNAILVVAALLAAASVAVLQINYALYAFFLTPTFILLAERDGPDYHLVGLRIVNTLIGAALAYVGARLLWPTSEKQNFPHEMAKALRSLERLFELAVDANAPQADRDRARRDVGIAINDADASFQRLLAEAGRGAVDMEPRMTLLLFARRFAGTCVRASTTGLARANPSFTKLAGDVLDSVAKAIETSTAPPPLPAPQALSTDDAALERAALQLRVLHDAAVRLARPLRPKPARPSASLGPETDERGLGQDLRR